MSQYYKDGLPRVPVASGNVTVDPDEAHSLANGLPRALDGFKGSAAPSLDGFPVNTGVPALFEEWFKIGD